MNLNYWIVLTILFMLADKVRLGDSSYNRQETAKLAAGAIVGIIIGCVVGIIACCSCICYFCCNCCRRSGGTTIVQQNAIVAPPAPTIINIPTGGNNSGFSNVPSCPPAYTAH
ncbi:probable inactive receptor kinase At5g16590 [Centruroides sculpturatus]|uniref:probable inactive receptor kinase At5g16590 n=1 Tax=Centruroides sculpturatus TaxID=218467 RepID=UPI000C6CEBF0|nr:probable inactive receptor kinase At5g16590 [Centruroides sculpturatus]XP_023224967.1 probable inactive receptor kinase At5g16590 [Centruroides sculpturatus]XP_023224968.1 probable inactive receptor kinase At5g16590 [Centruroides sculpturatus]XP_023224969.1 probable inactive receptor kinase At5g16590 [Centruroides sculpturatus]